MAEQPSSQNSSSLAGSTSFDTLLGRLVVEQGLATNEEVEGCQLKRKHGEPQAGQSLADLLVTHGFVTESQIDRVRQEVEASRGTQQIPGYKLLGRIGAGAMATVFKARQLSLDRTVAIKVLPQKFMSDPQFVERFYAEGRAAAKLNHPNIVQAIDVGQAGDHHYFVMEFVEGHTVYDALSKQGPYEETEALQIIIAVADALQHAHTHGFMHRDVKPKNIMITKAGVAKLADMGLAREISDKQAAQAEAGKAYGTPYYIAPEQIRGDVDIDFRADIYGLGATFYHMVTGKVPFDGPNPSAVMHKHLKEPLVPPDHLNDQLSTGVSEIIEVMMAKDRDERYDNTAGLLADLRSVAEGSAPLQARKKFDLSHLASIESKAETQLVETPSTPPMTESPLFWAFVISVAINLLLVVIAMIVFMGD